MRFLLYIAAAALVPAVELEAQEGGATATVVLEHVASPRAMALGGAVVASGDEDGSLFANPAALPGPALHGSVSGQQWIAGSKLGALSASYGMAGGTIALGVRALSYGSEREIVPDTINFGGQRGMETGRTIAANEIAASAGYARALGRARVGIALGWVRQQIANVSGGAPFVDLGANATLGRGVTAGVALQNLGGSLELASTASPLPRLVRAGLAVPLAAGPLRLLVSGEGVQPRAGGIEGRGGLEATWRSASGVAVQGRAGVRGGSAESTIGSTTFGGSVGTARVAADYAYQSLGALGGGTHRIGIRFAR
ncbi:MAG TPA: hypothetical protein VHM67_08545 [Gemmatimonadaceae bacterium]|nr:hypothetical protein [Gemmatimonadaceae bacterium]